MCSSKGNVKQDFCREANPSVLGTNNESLDVDGSSVIVDKTNKDLHPQVKKSTELSELTGAGKAVHQQKDKTIAAQGVQEVQVSASVQMPSNPGVNNHQTADTSDRSKPVLQVRKNPDLPDKVNPLPHHANQVPKEADDNKTEGQPFDESEKEEPLNPENLADLDGPGRDELYERGQEYDQEDKKAEALQCYLGCLTGLTNAEGFTKLPNCLHRIADLYYKNEEFEKAVQFIQAEKLFYETSLVDSETLKRRLVEKLSESEYDEDTQPELHDTADAQRAAEYECLGHICLKKDQVQLALEYQAKATKLRRQVFGETHGTTLRSLDRFTEMYGEMGKQQYSESMAKLKDKVDVEAGNIDDNPSSILRRRKHKQADGGDDKGNSQRVHFDDKGETVKMTEEEKREMDAYEHSVAKLLLLILFVICGLVLAVLLLYLYCHHGNNRKWCNIWQKELYYYYMRIKYFFYLHVAPSGLGQGG